MARCTATRPPKEWPSTTTGAPISSSTRADGLGVGLARPRPRAAAGTPRSRGGRGRGRRQRRRRRPGADDRVEVAVGPGPAVEGEDARRLRAGDRAEQAAAGEGAEHRSGHPARRRRAPATAAGRRHPASVAPAAHSRLPTAICRLLPAPRGATACGPPELPGHPTEGTTALEPREQPFGTVGPWRSRSKARPGRRSPERSRLTLAQRSRHRGRGSAALRHGRGRGGKDQGADPAGGPPGRGTAPSTPTAALVTTFSRKAAEELRTRLWSLGVSGVKAGTFHRTALAAPARAPGRSAGGAPDRSSLPGLAGRAPGRRRSRAIPGGWRGRSTVRSGGPRRASSPPSTTRRGPAGPGGAAASRPTRWPSASPLRGRAGPAARCSTSTT